MRILTVAWREFKHTALTKAFVFAAVGVPVLMSILLAVMPFLMRPNLTPLTGTLAVIASDQHVVEAVRTELTGDRLQRRIGRLAEEVRADDPTKAPTTDAKELADLAADVAGAATPVDLTIEPFPADAEESLKDRVRAGTIAAVAVVPAEALAVPAAGSESDDDGPGTFQLLVPPDFTPNHTMLLRRAVADGVARARAELAGVDYDAMRALIRAPTPEILRLERGGGQAKEQVLAKLMIPVAFMLLLWMSVFVSANYLLTTTVEEKGTRVMEVLLSAVSPMELMAGKILGQGMVSAVMLLAYGGAGLAALGMLALSDLVPASHFAYLGLYYVMAYFMIASLMAGVGSAANDMHEAQSLIGPVMLVLTVPLMLWFPISESPNGWLATVTSFIPPLIPFVMILRVTAANEPIAVWQIALSLVWGYTAMVGMVWLAARVFRVGVLMQGKTPTPRELLKWMVYR